MGLGVGVWVWVGGPRGDLLGEAARLHDGTVHLGAQLGKLARHVREGARELVSERRVGARAPPRHARAEVRQAAAASDPATRDPALLLHLCCEQGGAGFGQLAPEASFGASARLPRATPSFGQPHTTGSRLGVISTCGCTRCTSSMADSSMTSSGAQPSISACKSFHTRCVPADAQCSLAGVSALSLRPGPDVAKALCVSTDWSETTQNLHAWLQQGEK